MSFQIQIAAKIDETKVSQFQQTSGNCTNLCLETGIQFYLSEPQIYSTLREYMLHSGNN